MLTHGSSGGDTGHGWYGVVQTSANSRLASARSCPGAEQSRSRGCNCGLSRRYDTQSTNRRCRNGSPMHPVSSPSKQRVGCGNEDESETNAFASICHRRRLQARLHD